MKMKYVLMAFIVFCVFSLGVSCDDRDEEAKIKTEDSNITSPTSAEIDHSTLGQITPDELPLKTVYMDNDGDGYGDPENSIESSSIPEGYVDNNLDCNDWIRSVNPDGEEICDYLDNDCNGEIDNGIGTTFYRDSDGDGYGDPQHFLKTCVKPEGYVTSKGDIDDTNLEINPSSDSSKDNKGDCSLLAEPVLIDESLVLNGINPYGDVSSCSGVIRSQEELDEIWSKLQDRQLPVRPFPAPPDIDFDKSMLLWFASDLYDWNINITDDTEHNALCVSLNTSCEFDKCYRPLTRLFLWKTCRTTKEVAFNLNVETWSPLWVMVGTSPEIMIKPTILSSPNSLPIVVRFYVGIFSYDPIVSWKCNFGDGKTSNGTLLSEWDLDNNNPNIHTTIVDHTYTQNGEYQVTFIAVDSNGRTGAATLQVVNTSDLPKECVCCSNFIHQ